MIHIILSTSDIGWFFDVAGISKLRFHHNVSQVVHHFACALFVGAVETSVVALLTARPILATHDKAGIQCVGVIDSRSKREGLPRF